MFLQFSAPVGAPGISTPVGESTNTAHQKWVEVAGFQFGVDNPTTIGSATSGAGAGKAKFAEFQISKKVDASSPSLFTICATGAHFPTVTLAISRAGSTQGDFLTYEFHTVIVTSIAWASDDPAPTETVTFAYGALGVDYHTQDSTGKLGTGEIATWNQITNSQADNTVKFQLS
jgi:type VI secretion system secreted protein Hcp